MPTPMIKDPKARREAAEAAGLWSAEALKDDEKVEELGERGSEFYLLPRDCQGRPLKIFANGQFIVRWINAEGENVATRLLSKIFIPKTSIGRYLNFTEFGMYIVGLSGEKFRPQLFGWKDARATINVKSFVHDAKLVELWTTACSAHGQKADALKEDDTDAFDRDKNKGVKLLPGNAQSETVEQNRPPRRRDAIWLLEQFINQTEHRADGGLFRTASKDKFPDSTEDIYGFADFLKQPGYIKHPYTADWLRYLDNGKLQVQVLAKNLPIIRNCITVNQPEESKGLRVATKRITKDSSKGKQVHEQYFQLGGPGHAVDDPFADDSDQSCISAEQKKKKAKEITAAGDSGAESTKSKRKRAKDDDDDDMEEGDDEQIEEYEDPSLLSKAQPKKKKPGKKHPRRHARVEEEDE